MAKVHLLNATLADLATNLQMAATAAERLAAAQNRQRTNILTNLSGPEIDRLTMAIAKRLSYVTGR